MHILEDKKLEQNKPEDTSTFLGRSLLTGFIGGILAGLAGLFMYYFNFMEVSAKSYLLRSWTTAGWTDTWLGELLTIILVGLLSIGVALVYYGVLKKVTSLWMGIVYGLILWAIVFFILQPIFTNVPNLAEMEIKTIVSTLCLYILYGIFIGYSISFDYQDTIATANNESKKVSD
ncbi:YqhR family membrane protein [Paucisalibacillus sp. EB02]|uniref:YqhR family membrane protein n=1 Tax=Paucisalibacillus sp. EB02 TaxID=1347087 RepID=UPI00350F01A9